jgi:carbonic anhydrase
MGGDLMDLARTTALALTLAVLGCGGAPSPEAGPHPAAPHWSYTGAEGPSAWGDLAPAYALCKTGTKQSPIDIPRVADKGQLPAITFEYQPVPLQIRNNGHTVQVDNTTASKIVVGPAATDRYDLVQFHFHSPAEHTVAGEAFDLEMHLVHKNAAGDLAVVGVLFKKGKESPGLAPIFLNAPIGVSADAQAVSGVTVDLTRIVPMGAGYHRYSGSLTAPPCTEGVTWFVVAPIQEASDAQIARLREILHGATNRPVQPLGGRQVLEFRP